MLAGTQALCDLSPIDAERQETQKEGTAGKQRVATGPPSISEDPPLPSRQPNTSL